MQYNVLKERGYKPKYLLQLGYERTYKRTYECTYGRNI